MKKVIIKWKWDGSADYSNDGHEVLLSDRCKLSESEYFKTIKPAKFGMWKYDLRVVLEYDEESFLFGDVNGRDGKIINEEDLLLGEVISNEDL